MATKIWMNTGSSNGFLPYTKPSPEPTLIGNVLWNSSPGRGHKIWRYKSVKQAWNCIFKIKSRFPRDYQVSPLGANLFFTEPNCIAMELVYAFRGNQKTKSSVFTKMTFFSFMLIYQVYAFWHFQFSHEQTTNCSQECHNEARASRVTDLCYLHKYPA